MQLTKNPINELTQTVQGTN